MAHRSSWGAPIWPPRSFKRKGLRPPRTPPAIARTRPGGAVARLGLDTGWLITAPRLHQPVELPRVLARDLVRDVGRQVAELLGDVLRRLRPDAVGMRVVGAPHEGLDAHVVDQPGTDAVVLERRLALAAPLVARLHLESEVAEAVLPLVVHAIKRVGDPADAALAERDPDVRVALEDGAADDGGQDADQVELEARDGGEEGGPTDQALLLVDLAGRHRREGVEVQREVHVVHRLPERLPDRMPHGLHVPRARELHAAQTEPADAIDLFHGSVDVAVGQAREPDEPRGVVLAEVHEPVV